MAASRRVEWAERVRGWERSGLTAREYAESEGVRPETLKHWAWRLRREQRQRQRTGSLAAEVAPGFIEVVAAGAAVDERFELELGNGRRLRIPAGFEAGALERLLRVVEAGR